MALIPAQNTQAPGTYADLADGHRHLLMRGATAMSIKISAASGSCLTVLFASHGAMLQAASLRSPRCWSMFPPGATASLKLHNEGAKPLDAQVRIFKWTQVDGADYAHAHRRGRRQPAAGVAAAQHRLHGAHRAYHQGAARPRRKPTACSSTNCPRSPTGGAATVNIALRYSIPVFFAAPGGAAPKLSWELRQRANKPAIIVSNSRRSPYSPRQAEVHRRQGTLSPISARGWPDTCSAIPVESFRQ